MKAVLLGIAAALVLSVVAARVLDKEVQQDAEQRWQTQGVRL